MTGRLREIDDYQGYLAKLNAAPIPAEARSLEELTRIESILNADLSLPGNYTWGETEAAQLRDKWLADIPLLRASESAWQEWYRGLVNQALALTHARAFGGSWRDRVAALDVAAAQSPFEANAPIPGSQTLSKPRGESVTYRVASEFDRVYQAQRDWEFAQSRLRQLRDLADTLGLTSETSRRAMEIPPPSPGVVDTALPGQRLEELKAGVGGWALANFPEPGRALLSARVRESSANGAKHVQRLLIGKLAADSPEAWLKLADELNEPAIRDWGRLLHLLARLEDPQARDPVESLAEFLRTKEFTFDVKGFDLTIPLTLRVPSLVPTGVLSITITPQAGPAIVRTFKLAGEATSQGLNTVYRLVPEQSGTFTYKPGELLKAELPVRSGDQRFSLLWDEGTTRTFQFDRLSHEPRLGAAEAATGVTLVPVAGSRIPRAPLLLPELNR